MKYRCIFCECSLERACPEDGKETFQPNDGGEVRLVFDFGSRFDSMANRIVIPDGSGPDPEVLEMPERSTRLSACNRIMGVICDDCFETKSHLFYGFEKSPDGDLKELVG